MKKITINPVTRANSPFVVEVIVAGGKVVEARCSCLFFRGFELILKGREPRDASYLTERICGICSSAHGMAAAFALEDAAGVRPPRNGNILRNLIFGADFLQNHIRQFYLLTLPDFVQGPDLPPFVPGYKKGFRLSGRAAESMLRNYYEAFEMARIAHEMVALLGAKAPFPHGVLAGGSTVAPTTDVVMDFYYKLKKLNDFISNKMIPDVHTLADAYEDYYAMGCRKADMLEFGLFPVDERDRERHFPAGLVLDGRIKKMDPEAIREDVSRSWYAGADALQDPGREETMPDREKEEAYSWVKAPRYDGRAVEGGPLARLWIRGNYRRGISAMDRYMARVLETEMVGRLMEDWLDELRPGEPVFLPFKIPREAEGVGLSGAMRGPLGHWLRIKNGRIERYQIITPSAWNMSPRDSGGKPGPMEEALMGTPVADVDQPIELSRVVKSFDPCSACSTHVIVPGAPVRQFILPV